MKFGIHLRDRIAKRAAFDAMQECGITPPDRKRIWKDCYQEAEKAILEHNLDSKSDGYKYVAAKNKVKNFIWSYEFGDKARKPSKSRVQIFVEGLGDDELHDYAESISPSNPYREGAIKKLGKWLTGEFLKSRKKQGERGRRAAARESQAITLLMQGQNRHAIAREMGVSIRYVDKLIENGRKRIKGIL